MLGCTVGSTPPAYWLHTSSQLAPAEPVLHSPLCLLLPQEEPPLHSCYMGPCCYTNLCGMIAILLPGASACLGMNKAEKLQYSPSPTFITRRDPVSATLQLRLWPQFCQRQEPVVLLNHSKTDLNMHPLFNPVCTFHIPILSIIPYSIYLPRQCPI